MKLANKFSGRNKEVYVLDLDGTVYIEDKAIKNAISFINSNCDSEFYFITNNTSKSKITYVNKLSSMGIKNVTKEKIMTPIDPLLQYLHDNDITRVYCLGTDDFKSELTTCGVSCVDTDPQAVVLGFDTSLDYKKMSKCTEFLRNGVQYLATHADLVCPVENGYIPDVGSFMLLFEGTSGRKPDIVFGKPNKDLLQPILDRFPKKNVLVVGDRLYTDKLLAENCGVDFALVLTGETNKRDLLELEVQPSVVLQDLADLVRFR